MTDTESKVLYHLDRSLEDLFLRLDRTGITEQEVIGALNRLGWADMADAYWNWVNEQ